MQIIDHKKEALCTNRGWRNLVLTLASVATGGTLLRSRTGLSTRVTGWLIDEVAEEAEVAVDHVGHEAEGPFEDALVSNYEVVASEHFLEYEVNCHFANTC